MMSSISSLLRATIGDFQKALTLFFIEVTWQHDLAFATQQMIRIIKV